MRAKDGNVQTGRARHQTAAGSQWQQAVDPASGRTYYWHAETRGTRWQAPAEAGSSNAHAEQNGMSDSGSLSDSNGSTGAGDASVASSDSDSFTEMLQTLRAALQQDGSGMLFNETARSLRDRGVFSNEYFDYMAQFADSANIEDERLALNRILARLSNPLLRQAAPYE